MSEILLDYFKGFKNYFGNFNKSKVYNLIGKIVLIIMLISFSVISIPCFLFYKLGYSRAKKQLKDVYNRDKLRYLTGIHTTSENEAISISEVEFNAKEIKL